MRKIRVEDVMTNLVVKLCPNDTIHEAAARLAQNDISGAPVVEEGKAVGIVSEADLMRAALSPARVDKGHSTMNILGLLLRGQIAQPIEDVRVASVMSESVISIGPTATIWEAASVMERHGVKRLPVVDAERTLLGIVSRADLVAVMVRDDAELRSDVIDAIGELGEETIEGVRVQVKDGVVTLRGTTDRRTTRDLVVKIAATVPGVTEIVDRLEFKWDDTRQIPHQKDPWAVGALVKGA